MVINYKLCWDQNIGIQGYRGYKDTVIQRSQRYRDTEITEIQGYRDNRDTRDTRDTGIQKYSRGYRGTGYKNTAGDTEVQVYKDTKV